MFEYSWGSPEGICLYIYYNYGPAGYDASLDIILFLKDKVNLFTVPAGLGRVDGFWI